MSESDPIANLKEAATNSLRALVRQLKDSESLRKQEAESIKNDLKQVLLYLSGHPDSEMDRRRLDDDLEFMAEFLTDKPESGSIMELVIDIPQSMAKLSFDLKRPRISGGQFDVDLHIKPIKSPYVSKDDNLEIEEKLKDLL